MDSQLFGLLGNVGLAWPRQTEGQLFYLHAPWATEDVDASPVSCALGPSNAFNPLRLSCELDSTLRKGCLAPNMFLLYLLFADPLLHEYPSACS